MILVAGSVLLTYPAQSEAATQTGIGIAPPETLLSGIEFLNTGGAYYQANTVDGKVLTADFTLELPPPPTDAMPGPIVVFSQLVVSVTDVQFGDVSERAIGPPAKQTLVPPCEDSGGCIAHVRVSAPLASALEADELDWVLSTWVSMRLTAIRTFDGGALVQAVAPQVGWNVGNGWTIAEPADIEGTLTSAGVVPVAEAVPAHLPPDEFHIGNDEAFDWGAAVTEALAELPPTEQPDTGPEPRALTPALATLFLLTSVALFVLRFRRSSSSNASESR